MSSTKPPKPAKAKTPLPVKDLRPAKDAQGGAQKKEGPLDQVIIPTQQPGR